MASIPNNLTATQQRARLQYLQDTHQQRNLGGQESWGSSLYL